MQRKLTAILSADVVGYSGLMEADEPGTLARLKLVRSTIVEPHVAAHGGRVFKLTGDGVLAEFPSVVEAVNCALAIQDAMVRTEPNEAEEKRIRYRVGINLGDIIIDGDDIYGDGVNVAARLQALAPIGGIAVSAIVRDQVQGKASCFFEDMGEHKVKNLERPVHVFTINTHPDVRTDLRQTSQLKRSLQGQKQVSPVTAIPLGWRTLPSWRSSRAVRLTWAVVVLCALAVAGVSAWLLTRPASAPDVGEMRIAVLPFEAVAGDNVARTFAATLADEMTGALSENEGRTRLRIDSTRANPNRGREADLMVGGSVRTDGSTLRVHAYLEDPRSRATLWSSEYESPVAEAARLRDEVASNTTDMVYVALHILRFGEHVDPSTTALYIKAWSAMETPTPLNIEDSSLSLEEVIHRLPNFADAHASLAMNLSSPGSSVEAYDRARREAQRALALDPHDAEGAYDALHWIARHDAPRDFVKMEQPLLKGLAANPDYTVINMRECEFLTEVGRIKAAIPFCQHASALRPLAAPTQSSLAQAFYMDGQTELALEVITNAVRIHPTSLRNVATHLKIEVESASPDQATALLAGPEIRVLSAYLKPEGVQAFRAFVTARKSPTAANIETALRSAKAGQLSRDWVVNFASILGRIDVAYAELAGPQSLQGPDWWRSLLFQPYLAPLRRDTHFWPLAFRLGLVDYWRTKNVWPDFCADTSLPYDCKAVAAKLK